MMSWKNIVRLSDMNGKCYIRGEQAHVFGQE